MGWDGMGWGRGGRGGEGGRRVFCFFVFADVMWRCDSKSKWDGNCGYSDSQAFPELACERNCVARRLKGARPGFDAI